MKGKKALPDDEQRRRRLASLMRRLLRHTDTSSKDMSRAEYEMLLSLGFPVQGEQAFGDMAGSGRTWYFIMRGRREDAERVYEWFTGEKPPLPEPEPSRPPVQRGTVYVCCICDRHLYRRKSPPVVLHDVPICPRCAQRVAEKVAASSEAREDDGGHPSLAEMLSDLTWRQDVWEHWNADLIGGTWEVAKALLARGFECTSDEAVAVWRWYCRTHLHRQRLPKNKEEAEAAVDAFLDAWERRSRRPAMKFLWPTR